MASDDEEELSLNGDDVDGLDEGDGELADEAFHDDSDSDEEEESEEERPTEPSGPDTSARAYRGHRDSLYCLDVDAAGRVVCTGSGDDSARLYDRATLRTLAVLPCRETVAAVAFSLTGRFVATGSYDSVVRVWDAAAAAAAAVAEGGAGDAAPSPAALHELDGPAGDIEWLRWHPKGDVLLAGCSDGTAWMWSVAPGTAACMQVFAGHDGGVTCGAFTPDGKAVVTGGEDGTLRVWSPKNGTCTHTFVGCVRGGGVWGG